MVYMFIAVTSFAVALVGAILKAIWFRVEYAHESVTMRNGEVKRDKQGNPVIKTSGWHCQFPVRDHQHIVDCEQVTSHLAGQSLMAGDGKNDIGLSIVWHPLSRRDGKKYLNHPIRTLGIKKLDERVEEICRDAVRFVMATSKTPASQWESKDLYKAMKPLVKQKLEKIGVRFDDVMLPIASLADSQVQGQFTRDAGLLIKEGLIGTQLFETSDEESRPDLTAVPS